MPQKILIIDDEPALLNALRDYLVHRGFICECALEAAEAQALLAHMHFDIVVTDIFLSPLREADGLRVLAFIHERAINVRLVVLTAHASPEIESEALRLGAHAVLRKPTPLAVLADALLMVEEVLA